MNKRLKQLAEQAGMTDDKFGMYFANDKHNEDGVDLEKFAELILQDVRWVMQTAADDFILDTNYDAVKGVGRCMRRVKQHFGVEE